MCTEQKRAVIYARVSTVGQEENGTSLETQQQACAEYAEGRGYRVVGFYRETWSGAEYWERPELQRLLADIRAKRIDAVICHAIDRLARVTKHLATILTMAEPHGVTLEFVTESLDDSPEGQLLRDIMGYVATVEREKILERTIRGKKARVQSGKLPNFGGELFGYRRDKEAGVRSVRETEAVVVRRIFQSIADGESIRSLVRRLNTEGIPSPAVGRRAYHGLNGGPKWCQEEIRRILRDPAYKGETFAWRWKRDGKNGKHVLRPADEWVKLPEGTSPLIVTALQWDMVQTRVGSNRGEATRNETRPYLLRGIIYCSVCGRKMRSSPEHGRRVYRCSSRETPAGPCGGKRVPADAIEEEIWAKVSSLMHNPSALAPARYKEAKENPDGTLETQLASLRREVAGIGQKQARLIARLGDEDGGAVAEAIKRTFNAWGADRLRLQGTVSELESTITQQERSAKEIGDLEAYCHREAEDLDNCKVEKKRQHFEKLKVRVSANGRDWLVTGGLEVKTGEPPEAVFMIGGGERGKEWLREQYDAALLTLKVAGVPTTIC